MTTAEESGHTVSYDLGTLGLRPLLKAPRSGDFANPDYVKLVYRCRGPGSPGAGLQNPISRGGTETALQFRTLHLATKLVRTRMTTNLTRALWVGVTGVRTPATMGRSEEFDSPPPLPLG